ncbi:hypothetical protein F6A13_03485 [Acidithiobacillus sp. 'AMD consortium']|jgi:hypothetical protein|uniref:hypothetical protein n=1 Tax=Acidithiobacillus TaxID=119977 RepID=UPI00124DFF14|nr:MULTISPECIES: hypothetical protein [Acidithiobacillus]MBU2721332.1 hypothetical protein [Acidithiobacillus ferridurans]MBU2803921.1 hypothetical protein [Acidithiobacillus ferridurans]MBU2823399.1 hypothetical protein [Acidithiobacillus ferrooxidans]QFG77800.1 hypothetical protein F6A13_03485 [Acidithiobacillus sp. 'AMD consortium']
MNNSNQVSDMIFSSIRKLEHDELLLIEETLAAMECVLSAHQGGEHHEHHGHHYKVAYDPSCMDSHTILEKLKGLGVEARMIGL